MSKQFIMVTRLNGDVSAVNVSKIVEIISSDEEGAKSNIVLEACGKSRHYRGFSVRESVGELLIQLDDDLRKRFICVTCLNGKCSAVSVSRIVEIMPPNEENAKALILLDPIGFGRLYQCLNVLESMCDILKQFDDAFN